MQDKRGWTVIAHRPPRWHLSLSFFSRPQTTTPRPPPVIRDEPTPKPEGYPSNNAPVPQSCVRGYDADHCPSMSRNGVCNPECNTPACGSDGGDCSRAPPPPPPAPTPEPSCARGYPASHCPTRARNGICDPVSIIFNNFYKYFIHWSM